MVIGIQYYELISKLKTITAISFFTNLFGRGHVVSEKSNMADKQQQKSRGADQLEKGIAENERRNQVSMPRGKADRDRGDEDDSTIRQTRDKDETDSVGGGGDLAGNAAGNPDD